MYQLKSGIARPKNKHGRWIEVDFASIQCNTIFQLYEKAFVVLTNVYLEGDLSLNLTDVQGELQAYTGTFTEWLVSKDETALPTSSTIPMINTRYVRYGDAWGSKYNVEPSHPTAAPDAELPRSELTDLYITRDIKTDFTKFYKSCMVLVNGYYHRTLGDGLGVRVIDGMKSQHVSQEAVIGFTDFEDIGALTFYPITPNMLYKQNPDSFFRHQTFVDLGVSLEGKTLIVVLGGYMHILDSQTIFRVNDTSFGIDVNNLPLIARYHDSMRYLDFSALPFHRSSNNDSQISVSNFLSDENLTAYFTMSQSFVALLDTDDVYIERVMLENTPFNNAYLSHQNPKYPLFGNLGRHLNYWSRYENQQWSVNVIDNVWNERLYDTVDVLSQDNVADSRVPEHIRRPCRAFLLKIGKDL